MSKPRGFATLTPERRTEIASKGGKAAWAQGRAHRFTKDEAKKAAELSVEARQEKELQRLTKLGVIKGVL